jgi:hypothetical protein
MSDRDNSPKGLLQRWSRRKIENAREGEDAPVESHATDMVRAAEPGAAEAAAAGERAFDLASLPSLHSITALTDIRAFLASGVPNELARAALRRAWAADPAIRDFKGLAENAWDFTDPTAMPGFGALPESTDVRKLVAQIFGEREKPSGADRDPGGPDDPQPTLQVTEAAAAVEPPAPTAAAPVPPPAAADLVQRDKDIAPHNSASQGENPAPRRQHGSALPR